MHGELDVKFHPALKSWGRNGSNGPEKFIGFIIVMVSKFVPG